MAKLISYVHRVNTRGIKQIHIIVLDDPPFIPPFLLMVNQSIPTVAAVVDEGRWLLLLLWEDS